MPRVSQNQQNRSNPQLSSVEDYFKKTIAIPFLDRVIRDISSRLQLISSLTSSAISLKHYSNFVSIHDEIQEAITFYSDDLPNPAIVDEELCLWKSKWLLVSKEDRPGTLS